MDSVRSSSRHTFEARADADYGTRLQEWERTSASMLPALAVERIRTWLWAGNVDARLSLSRCGLRDLPPLPANVRVLSVNNNRDLKKVDRSWPAGLESLDASNCDLRQLPDWPLTLNYLNLTRNRSLAELPPPLGTKLEAVHLDFCGFRQLPASWPGSLRSLSASHCQLQEFPHGLPWGVLVVNVEGNQLTALPNMPLSLEKLNVAHNAIADLGIHLMTLEGCRINWLGNPVSVQQAEGMRAQAEAPGYRGPTITFCPVGSVQWATVPANRRPDTAPLPRIPQLQDGVREDDHVLPHMNHLFSSEEQPGTVGLSAKEQEALSVKEQQFLHDLAAILRAGPEEKRIRLLAMTPKQRFAFLTGGLPANDFIATIMKRYFPADSRNTWF
jgi:hypothetical protein